jgi:hypothetical protein
VAVAAAPHPKRKVKQMELKVEVKYNSYLDGIEIGDLSCSQFRSYIEFCEHVAAVANLIPLQLKHDPQYRDIHEARMDVFVNGQHMATQHFRRVGFTGEISVFNTKTFAA